MKKSSLVICSSLLMVALSGCGMSETVSKIEDTTETVEENTVLSTELPEVQEVESVTEESTEEEDNTVIFTQDKLDSLKDYLSAYTYVNLTQTMENGVEVGIAYTKVAYDVTADTVSKVVDFSIHTTYSDGDSSGVGDVNYYHDFANDITLVQNDEEAWEEAEGEIPMISWDILNYESAWDIYEYLLNGNDIEVGTEGTSSGEYEYYDIVTEADEDMITGLTYDILGDQTISFIFRNVGGTISPSTIILEIQYFVGDTEYYVRATINMGSLGNSELAMPEY